MDLREQILKMPDDKIKTAPCWTRAAGLYGVFISHLVLMFNVFIFYLTHNTQESCCALRQGQSSARGQQLLLTASVPPPPLFSIVS